ncbi:MAG: transposase, partial [Candidatus Acidiferrum sp.]
LPLARGTASNRLDERAAPIKPAPGRPKSPTIPPQANIFRGAHKKHAVMTLVDRDGESRSFHVANVKAKTLRETIVTTVSRKSHLMTDELASYEKVGKEFANHGTVYHSAGEYVRLGGFVYVNTPECRFSLTKRAVFGTNHSISEVHLPR